MMMTKIRIAVTVVMVVAIAIAWVSIPAFASGYEDDDSDGSGVSSQDQAQQQGQQQGQQVTVNIGGGEGQPMVNAADTTTMNAGDTSIDLSDNSRVENSSSNTVLVPNNNTENCLRVFGIAWGKGGESGALGVPWRSKKCDYEQAADDAFAAGERELGWFWKCQNPNLYKSFKPKGVDAPTAMISCHMAMVGSITQLTTIDRLTERLTMVESERTIERRLAKESRERITKMCEESKDKIFAACQK